MSAKWNEILAEIGELEKKSPYNFCDRWCERCLAEKRLRCKVHHDELEQAMLCMAHGRDEQDPEITKQVLERQFKDAFGGLEGGTEEAMSEEEGLTEIDPGILESPEFSGIREHIKFIENHPLPAAAEAYYERAHAFLELFFFNDKGAGSPGLPRRELQNDLEVIAWYHTLLPVKIERGLAGFHEQACDGDLALYDAVGQFEICKKAVRESLQAFRNVRAQMPGSEDRVRKLLALLHHLDDRIRILEDSL